MTPANDNGPLALAEYFLSRPQTYDSGFTRFLYLMQCEHFLKVGVARDVERRRLELQSGNPFPVKTLISRQVPSVFAFMAEKRIHAMLAEHAHRNEWFVSDLATTRRAFSAVTRAAKLAAAMLADEERRAA